MFAIGKDPIGGGKKSYPGNPAVVRGADGVLRNRGEYDASGKMLSMREQPYYESDAFGLKTLDTSGRLNLTIVPGASHGDWTGNEQIIRTYVLPHCT